MSSFGATLRGERENRGISIRELSTQMGVHRDRLIALERDDFAALPDDATMLPLLHTYAARLGVEAELMIEDYQRERDACLAQLSRAVDQVAMVGPVAPVATRTHRKRASAFPRMLLFSALAGAFVIVGAWWLFTPSGVTAPAGVLQSESPSAENETAPIVAASTAPAMPAPAAPVAPVALASTPLTVTTHGVGTAVRNRRLVGQADRFDQGTKVWYWTEIQGGEAGDRIEHVWIADGQETARVQLELGGPRWRTYSAKTLHSGSGRDWAVEVHDSAGRVLAREEFMAIR